MIEMNKRMFEVSIWESSSEEYIRKASIVLAVIGFFSHISVWGLYSTGRISVTGEATELLPRPCPPLHAFLYTTGLRGIPVNEDHSRVVLFLGR